MSVFLRKQSAACSYVGEHLGEPGYLGWCTGEERQAGKYCAEAAGESHEQVMAASQAVRPSRALMQFLGSLTFTITP